MLRITGGANRGRVLPAIVPEGVRPTSSRAREALFSMIGQDLAGLTFLDAFGGAGAIGLEAASRGATVTLAERAAAALATIRENVAAAKATVTVRAADVAALAEESAAFDIVYLDPPFAEDIVAWATRMAPVARQVLVAEARSGAVFPESLGGLSLDRVRKYGDTTLAIYRRSA